MYNANCWAADEKGDYQIFIAHGEIILSTYTSSHTTNKWKMDCIYIAPFSPQPAGREHLGVMCLTQGRLGSRDLLYFIIRIFNRL